MNWERLRRCDEIVQSAIADGEYRQALEALLEGYQDAVVGFCHNMLTDAAQAEEVAQDVFIAAYKALPRFQYKASVRTWLFAIARKQCLQAIRNSGRRRRIAREKASFIAQSAHRDPPASLEEDPEGLMQLVKIGLTKLQETEKAVLTMRYDTGLSVADMAPILGVSIATVRRRLAEALTHLREVITREAG